MTTGRINGNSINWDVRFPHLMAEFLQGVADVQFDGNRAAAIRYCVELTQLHHQWFKENPQANEAAEGLYMP